MGRDELCCLGGHDVCHNTYQIRSDILQLPGTVLRVYHPPVLQLTSVIRSIPLQLAFCIGLPTQTPRERGRASGAVYREAYAKYIAVRRP